jgi:hypothetical protein
MHVLGIADFCISGTRTRTRTTPPPLTLPYPALPCLTLLCSPTTPQANLLTFFFLFVNFPGFREKGRRPPGSPSWLAAPVPAPRF